MEREILSTKKSEELFKLIPICQSDKMLKVGLNETIKAVKSGKAMLVVLADDSVPKCLTESVVVLCEQRGVQCVYVSSQESLGKACKMETTTIAVAIAADQDADTSKIMKKISTI